MGILGIVGAKTRKSIRFSADWQYPAVGWQKVGQTDLTDLSDIQAIEDFLDPKHDGIRLSPSDHCISLMVR
jgi:hypothetical protein